MKDLEYFQNYLKAYQFAFESNQETYTYIKDSKFCFQFISAPMFKLLGITNTQQIYGENNHVLFQSQLVNEKFIERMNSQDNVIRDKKKSGCYLELIPYENSFRLIVLRKNPIINPHTGNFIGIQGEVSDLVWPNVLKTLFNFHETKGLLVNHKNTTDPIKDYPISNVQHMVLYLCINNYSYSEIALLMNMFGYKITPIRVNDYLEQLKLIFHVRTKTQLIEKAIGLNFHALLPYDLFNNVNSIDIRHEISKVVCCNCKLNSCNIHNRADASKINY